jgi:hypothetical protein
MDDDNSPITESRALATLRRLENDVDLLLSYFRALAKRMDTLDHYVSTVAAQRGWPPPNEGGAGDRSKLQ